MRPEKEVEQTQPGSADTSKPKTRFYAHLTNRFSKKQCIAVLILALAVAILAVYLLAVGHVTKPSTGVANQSQQNYITISTGASRSLSRDFLGYNGDGLSATWSNPSLLPALSALNPETIRGIDGGTQSDYYNWQTGNYFIASNDPNSKWMKPTDPNMPLSFNEYLKALKTAHADGIFNINVMTYCPLSNTNPASTSQAGASCSRAQACGPNPSEYTTECTNTDYTWGLDFQVAMLQAARSKGVPIKYIELGNELYIPNNPDYAYYFPSTQDYINKVNAWIPILKSDFPGAEIAVIGDPKTAGSKVNVCQAGASTGGESAWNQAIINGVHGENAITFHTYYASGIPKGGSVSNPGDLATMLSTASQSCISNFQNNIPKYLPKGVSAWITEWNLWSEHSQVVHGSWAQGLTEASYALDLARQPQVELADNHALVRNQTYGALFDSAKGYSMAAEAGKAIGTPSPLPTTQPFGKTAGGFALSALQRSLHGATGTTALNFSTAPDIAGTSVPGLMGQSFIVNNKTNLYFVNLSANNENISLGNLSGHYSVLQYATDPANFITGDSSIPAKTFMVTGSLNLPAYSVTSLITQ